MPLGFSGDLSPVRWWPVFSPARPLPTVPLSFLFVWVTVRATQVHWPQQWPNHEWAVSLITVAACVRLQIRHRQTCSSPLGIHHAHPVQTQACLSRLSPLIPTPPGAGMAVPIGPWRKQPRDRWGAAQSHTLGEAAPTPSPSGQETTCQNLHGMDRWACAGRASIAQTGALSCKAPSGVLLAEKIWHVQIQRCCSGWGPRPMSRLPQPLWTLTGSPGTDCSEPRQKNTQGT